MYPGTLELFTKSSVAYMFLRGVKTCGLEPSTKFVTPRRCWFCALLTWARQVTLLGARVEEAAASAEASADKIGAVDHKTKALSGLMESLQQKTATDLPALENKVLHEACVGPEKGSHT